MSRWFKAVWWLFVAVGCSAGPEKASDKLDAQPEVIGSASDVILKSDVAAPVDGLGKYDLWKAPTDGAVESEVASPQCQSGEGCFLDECGENNDCQSGWCVQHLGEGVCSQSCQEECPPGWSCQQVAGTDPDVVYICVSDYANLCRPCHVNDDCSSSGGSEDACLDYGPDGNFCGGPCSDDQSCPWGFSCEETETVQGTTLKQCVNDTGECPCTDSSVALGLTTACFLANEFGECVGKRACADSGLGPCDALVPALEVCNGLDDDCDGEIDEPELLEGAYVHLCEDGNECTQDKCVGEPGCVNDILNAGVCEDGNPCTIADHCVAGTCLGDPVECDDDNPCTDNACSDTGGCEYTPNAAACDDANPCTVGDQCADGSCSGTPVACDCLQDVDCAALEDGDQCNGTLVCDTSELPYQCVVDPVTIVVCDEPSGPNAFCLASLCEPETGVCSDVPHHSGFLCDNGDACTVNDHCEDGSCLPGTAVNCNDGDDCTDDSCVANSGCLHSANEGPCDDGDLCTLGDTCSQGDCLGGVPLACDDLNDCTEDSCLAGVGCAHAPFAGSCDDGNACTIDDSCDNGKCTPGVLLDCDDGKVCTSDSCTPDGGCIYELNSAPCDDEDLCTIGDHCHLGECTGGGELSCDDGNLCTDDSCNPLAGCQFNHNSVPCDDGDGCTLSGSCAGGWCVAGAPISCDDQNPCTLDECSDGECENSPFDGPCEDGDACTLGDLCVGGICIGGGVLDCNDQNLCTDDICDALTGCSNLPNVVVCDDGDICTDGDMCGQGTCQAGLEVDCDDQEECTVDECGDPNGCSHSAKEDGTVCGPGGTWFCIAGVCTDCVPSCDGKECGSDGCAGSCGDCPYGEACLDGSCIPKHIWSKSFGGFGDDLGTALATDAQGAVYMAGKFSSQTLDFGGGALSAGAYVVKFDANGNHVWSVKGPGSAYHDIDVDAEGNAYVCGPSILARINAAGTVGWSNTLSGAHGRRLVVDSNNNVYVTGDFSGAGVNLGGGNLPNAGSKDVLLARYATTGGFYWAKAWGGDYIDEGHGVGTDGAGNVYVATIFKSSSFTLGGGTFANVQQGKGDLAIARFSNQGVHQWSHAYGSAGQEYVHALTVTVGGLVAVAGEFWGSGVDFGNGEVASNMPTHGDIYVAAWDLEGNPAWAVDFGAGPWNTGSDLAADVDGDLYVAGFYGSNTIDFGGGAVPYGYASDIFFVRLKSDGTTFWWKNFVAQNNEFARAIAVDPEGYVFVSGEIRDPTLDVGGGKLPYTLGEDIFLTRFGQPGEACVPACGGKECGDNGCGGTCGTCDDNQECVAGKCAGALMLYFTDVSTSVIGRSNLDGSAKVNLISGGIDADDIAIDVAGGKMYWPDDDTSIRRADLDGGNVETLIANLPSPYGIALDVEGGRVYWTNQTGNPKVQRANLDGTNVEDLVAGSGCCTIGLALDVPGGRMYWMDGYYNGTLSRAALDGSGVQVIANTSGIANGVALDLVGGKVYWTEYGGGKDFVRRANLDGSAAQVLLSGGSLKTPQGIIVDSAGGKFYFADLHSGNVKRANLDGSGLETIISGLGYPRGVALGP